MKSIKKAPDNGCIVKTRAVRNEKDKYALTLKSLRIFETTINKMGKTARYGYPSVTGMSEKSYTPLDPGA